MRSGARRRMTGRGPLRSALPLGAALVVAGCIAGDVPAVEQTAQPIAAYCTVTVNGVGQRDMETDYLPHVIQCENGGAPLEALKAQAVAARSYAYYKIETSGSVNDGTSDQVYSCGRTPAAIHLQAVQETAGQILRYSNTTVCAFYVAGAIPSAASCVATGSDSDPTGTEHYVTYNWGLSGGSIEQTTLGWVSPSNYRNRGCKSQNGASCLASHGWVYGDILKFYYGMDIELHQATGSCVTPTECTSGQSESRDCAQCGTETRTCQSDWTWGAFGACTGQGECAPGATEMAACGECGQRTRTCEASCTWGAFTTCQSVQTDEPCDTGQLGACAEGRLRCEATSLVCVPMTVPALERCDDLDNDCNGEVDEGLPPVLGNPPPALAAEAVVAQAPDRLEPGVPGSVTLWIANRGTADWAPSALVLQARGDGAGGPSLLYTEGQWVAADLVGPLDQAVPAGGEAELTFSVTLPPGVTEPVREIFWLAVDTGEPLACPAPAVTLEIAPDGTLVPSRPDAGPGVDPGEVVRSGCTCATGPGPASGPDPSPLLALLVLLGLGRLRSRRRR